MIRISYRFVVDLVLACCSLRRDRRAVGPVLTQLILHGAACRASCRHKRLRLPGIAKPLYCLRCGHCRLLLDHQRDGHAGGGSGGCDLVIHRCSRGAARCGYRISSRAHRYLRRIGSCFCGCRRALRIGGVSPAHIGDVLCGYIQLRSLVECCQLRTVEGGLRTVVVNVLSLCGCLQGEGYLLIRQVTGACIFPAGRRDRRPFRRIGKAVPVDVQLDRHLACGIHRGDLEIRRRLAA